MENIHTILEKYGITVDEERKADFEKEFAENYKTVAEHSKVVSARDGYKTQLEAAQNALKDLKDVDVGELKGKISKLTNELNTQKTNYEQQLADLEFGNILDGAIASMKGREAKAVKAMLDIDALKASKNQAADIKTALEELKEKSGYLFEDEETPPPYAAGTGGSSLSTKYSSQEAAIRSAMGLKVE